jgi:purine-binding chemotaxis protein CheW
MAHPGNENIGSAEVPVRSNDGVRDTPGAAQAPAPADAAKFVSFSLNDKVFAVPGADIAEVILPLPVAPLPGSPAWFPGLANFRGELLGILDLKVMWNDEGPASPDKAKFIVLKARDNATRFALKVDRLREIVTISSSDIQPVTGKTLPHISGTAPRGAGTLHVIDTTRLLESLAFD